MVAGFLGLREGLSSESGLVDGDVDGLCETAIGGDNVTDLEGNHVTRNQVGRLDFGPVASALDFGLGGEGVHEGFDSVTGVAFFVETDGGIDEEEENDTDEIRPIGGLALTVREDDGDKSSGFHDP